MSSDRTGNPQASSPGETKYYVPTDPSVGMNTEQLKARLYATSEIYTNSRPQLKVARRRSTTSDVQVWCT